MPELAEVEIARRCLTRWTVGRRIVAVDVIDARVVATPESVLRDALVGASIARWERRGKQLLAVAGEHALLAHLGMTGKWVSSPAPGALRHACIRLETEEGAVTYTDVRRFGEVRLECISAARTRLAALGPDAWDAPMSPVELHGSLARTARPLVQALMDQSRVAGLGNIAVIEAAFRAGLHPLTPASDLGLAACTELLRAIREHLAMVLGRDDGEPVAYVSEGAENPFLVYGRRGEGCPRCAATLAATSHAGRPVVWCEACQPKEHATA